MSSWKKYIDSINLSGNLYSRTDLLNLNINDKPKWELSYYSFINEWINDDNYIIVYTSGSTGQPKKIKIHKDTFVSSALNTGKYLELKPDDKALLCLPGEYIAGKMMIIRSFVLKLNLIWQKPSSIPIIDQNYDFSAMTPMQLQKVIDSDKSKIERINKLIIGGAPINDVILNLIRDLRTSMFETYGMTETASHIALKALNGKHKSEYFSVLEGINVSKDDRNCLKLESPYLLIDELISNDIIELKNDKQFKWLGRIDNVINSGGIKLIPEQIEKKLKDYIPNDFFVFGIKDELLTEVPALIIESNMDLDIEQLSKYLSKYEIPKKVFYTEAFIRTASGKIKRKETIKRISLNLS